MNGRVAEWSKALVSGTSLRAWVRIPSLSTLFFPFFFFLFFFFTSFLSVGIESRREGIEEYYPIAQGVDLTPFHPLNSYAVCVRTQIPLSLFLFFHCGIRVHRAPNGEATSL